MEIKMLLDGIWDFSFTKYGKLADFDVRNASFDQLAAVPGCFDATMNLSFQKGLAVYRREVEVSGRQKLTIEGVGLRGKVYWDGKLIGECPVPFCAEEIRFDAGDAGKHELIIAVDNHVDTGVDSVFREYYDFYPYGGIYRSVSIEKLEDVEITYIKAVTRNLEKRTVEVTVELDGNYSGKTIELYANGKPAASAAAVQEFTTTFDMPGAALWDTESPNLHTLEVKVGSVTRTETFGIREITCKDGKILLNGKAFKIFGVNRHECHPNYGYAVPANITLDDVLAIKKQGFNCIRGSHYPQSKIFLDICDRAGMLVWNESLGWQNKVEALNSPGFQQLFLRQTTALVKRSVNHPCVVMWGFLNETYSNHIEARPFMETLEKYVRKMDDSRPLTYASNRMAEDLCMDLSDIMSFNTYPCWYGFGIPDADPTLEEFSRQPIESAFKVIKDFSTQEKFNKRPVLISEIGAEALPGDHSGLRWSEDYQADLIEAVLDLVEKDDVIQGVFLWMYCDTKTYSNMIGQARARGYNNKGLVDEYRRPKLSWQRAGKFLANKQAAK